jgi:hypothetical protein
MQGVRGTGWWAEQWGDLGDVETGRLEWKWRMDGLCCVLAKPGVDLEREVDS